MKKFGFIFGNLAALALCGCFAAPQMRMTTPENEADYNGAKVFVHSIDEGDFGTGKAPSKDSSNTEDFGDLADLIVDSIPPLEYRIGPLDVVQVIIWEHPELTSPMGQYQPAGQKVTTDGKLFYPYAGEIQAAGLTAQELRDEITKRLSDKILNNPQVDVRVSDYKSLKATITGSVNKPGFAYFTEAPMTIPTAISEAGGFDEYADPSKMQLRRGDKVYDIDFLEAFKTNVPIDRILLQPGDQLYIPALAETQRSNHVYVMGEVGKPSVIELHDEETSLVEALASAGGLQAVNASASSIYVIRNTSEEQIDVYHLNAKNAIALAMADRFKLNTHDIVYVDASGLATWNRLIGLILPSVQTVYYGVQTTRNIQLITNGHWGQK